MPLQPSLRSLYSPRRMKQHHEVQRRQLVAQMPARISSQQAGPVVIHSVFLLTRWHQVINPPRVWREEFSGLPLSLEVPHDVLPFGRHGTRVTWPPQQPRPPCGMPTLPCIPMAAPSPPMRKTWRHIHRVVSKLAIPPRHMRQRRPRMRCLCDQCTGAPHSSHRTSVAPRTHRNFIQRRGSYLSLSSRRSSVYSNHSDNFPEVPVTERMHRKAHDSWNDGALESVNKHTSEADKAWNEFNRAVQCAEGLPECTVADRNPARRGKYQGEKTTKSWVNIDPHQTSVEDVRCLMEEKDRLAKMDDGDVKDAAMAALERVGQAALNASAEASEENVSEENVESSSGRRHRYSKKTNSSLWDSMRSAEEETSVKAHKSER